MHATDYLKAIRRKCFDCCAGQKTEVEKCPVCHCPLYPYRQVPGCMPLGKDKKAGMPLGKAGGAHERENLWD